MRWPFHLRLTASTTAVMALGTASWLFPSVALAGDICVDLAPITTAAAKGFAPLRAEALPVAGLTQRWTPYPAPSELGECVVEADPWGSRYNCLVNKDMELDDALARLDTLTSELKSCLPLSWELRDVPGPDDLGRRVFVQPDGPPSTVVAIVLRKTDAAGELATLAVQFVRQGASAQEATEPVLALADEDDLGGVLSAGDLDWNYDSALGFDDDDNDPYLHARLGGTWVPGLLEPAYQGTSTPRDTGFTVDMQGAHAKDWNAFVLRYGRDSWALTTDPEAEDPGPGAVLRNRIEVMMGANGSLFPDGPFVPGLELLVGIGASWGRQEVADTGASTRMSGFGPTYQAAVPLTILIGEGSGVTLRPAIGRSPYGNGDPTHRGANRYDYPFMTAWQAELGVYIVTR